MATNIKEINYSTTAPNIRIRSIIFNDNGMVTLDLKKQSRWVIDFKEPDLTKDYEILSSTTGKWTELPPLSPGDKKLIVRGFYSSRQYVKSIRVKPPHNI